MLRALAWFAGILLTSLTVSMLEIGIRSSARRLAVSRSPETRGASPAPRPTPRGVPLESLGRFPSDRVSFAPSHGRIYAGTAFSDDAGRSWSALSAGGRRLLLLGGSRAFLPRPRADGSVLLGEVLVYDSDPALGTVAHAAIARPTGLEVLIPEADHERVMPQMIVRGLGHSSAGQWVVATSSELLRGDGRSRSLPGETRAFLAASDGSFYVSLVDNNRFPLFHAGDFEAAWLPVAGARDTVTDLAEGAGSVYSAGRSLGRRTNGQWRFGPWPGGGSFERIAAHPGDHLLAAWGPEGLAVSLDGGERLARCDLGRRSVSWAAWDPAGPGRLVVLDRHGDAWALDPRDCR